MNKYLIVILLYSFALNCQTGKQPNEKAENNYKLDSLEIEGVTDTIDYREVRILEKGEFAVYTRYGKFNRDKRTKLCFNLVDKGRTYNFCVNDSTCRDPEVVKLLFQREDGDTIYSLVFVDAFTKYPPKPACDAGHETKFIFVKWNPQTNKADWKFRTISSCMKAITNMTKEQVTRWDGKSPLVVSYHRGKGKFIEAKFDPANYKQGVITDRDEAEKESND